MHEFDEKVGVVGANGVLDRRERIVVCGPPACGAAVQVGGPSLPAGKRGAQVGWHKRVDAESPGRPPLDEPGVPAQPVQHLAGVAPAAEGGREVGSDRLAEAGRGEQVTVRDGQDSQHLVHEEVGHGLGRGATSPQEGVRIGPAAQGGGGEPNPGGPAAGAGVQRTRLGLVEVQLRPAQHLVGLVRREAQRVGADLAQLPGGPQRPERQGGVPTAAEDEAYLGRRCGQ